MKTVYCLLYLLVSSSIVFASDNGFTIKLKGFPVDGIEWGSSPQKLNIDPKELECEHIKPSKEQCSESGICGESDECDYYVSHEGRFLSLNFVNNRLLYVTIISKPNDFAKEVAFYNSRIGNELTWPKSSDNSEIYIWESLNEEYKLRCYKSTGKCFLSHHPSRYVDISTKQPAKEKFMLLDLTLGYSTSNDFIQIANSNKWKWYKGKSHSYDTYYAYNILLDEIIDTEFEFIDDRLESITYIFGLNKTKINYYDMLTKKYGKPKEDNGSYVIWETNKETRDEITIGLSYGKTHDNIKDIWYSHAGLGAKSSDKMVLKARTKILKEEKVFQKAF